MEVASTILSLLSLVCIFLGQVTRCEDQTQSGYSQRILKHIRSRRSAYLADEKYRWTKGIVPYVMDTSVLDNADALLEIKRAMATYERFTCLRFVEWTETTNADLGLGHDGHLNFKRESKCSATQGNVRKITGQHISCCSEDACIHELGHAIGFIHEQKSPSIEGWLRVDMDNVKEAARAQYSELEKDEVITDGFNYQSVMMYALDAHSHPDGSGPPMTLLYPDLEVRWDNHYYIFRAVASMNQCGAVYCPDFTMTCVNGGFLTLVNGECACMCPEGLDPLVGCRDIRRTVPPGTAFPGGKWGLPMTTSGCPDDALDNGYRHHATDATDGPNLKSDSYHLNGTIEDGSAEHYFCVNSGNAGDSGTYWGQGNYCVYPVGGTCPEEDPNGTLGTAFQEGHIDFYFNKWLEQATTSGTLPDGDWDVRLTKFHYCCRNTGFVRYPLYLPNQTPLALFMPQYTFECQKIFGMHASQEWVALNSLDYSTATYFGETPFMKQTYPNIGRMYIKHCYYEPAITDCGEMIVLSKNNRTVTFTSPKADNLDCTWHISAPANSRIKLDLFNMNVRGSLPGCHDYVSVRHVRMGQVGVKYCGVEAGQSIISHYNQAMINFVTRRNSDSEFTVTASLIPDDELCYSTADQGLSYSGTVNYTKSFTPCLPWSEVTHCDYHAYNFDDTFKNLDNNYCRNPGNGLSPWCYTKAYGCVRDYCDVCDKETRFDRNVDCDVYVAAGNCTSDPLAISKCPKSCKGQLPIVDSTPVSSVLCPYPPHLPDGALTAEAKTSYNVGEKVTYRCSNVLSQTELGITCLSDGQWSPVSYACTECHEGWEFYRGSCYNFNDEPKLYPEAQAVCAQQGAILAMAKDEDTNNFLSTMRKTGKSIWLGGQSPDFSSDWSWEDGTAWTDVSWTNWDQGFPILAPRLQCLVLRTNDMWEDGHCNYRQERFICEKASYDFGVCADQLATCENLLAISPDMCTKYGPFSHQACAKTCGFCVGGNECSVILPTQNANIVHKSIARRGQVPEGTEVHYACQENMVYQSGDYIRTCQNGALSGSDLLCMEESKGKKDEEGPCQVPMDLVFLTDATRSLSNDEFNMEMDFVNKLTCEFSVAIDKTRISVVEFAHTYYKLFCLNQHYTNDDVSQAMIDRQRHIRGSTKVYRALSYLNRAIFVESCGSRPDIPKVLVIVMDGKLAKPETSLLTAASMKASGITIVTVGVLGSDLDLAELESLASSPDLAIIADDFASLDGMISQVSSTICTAASQSKK